MKKIILLVTLITFSSCIYFTGTGCDGCDGPPRRVSEYKPVILKKNKLDETIILTPAREVEKSSKIYIYKNLIFINDKLKGFHILDNSNPEKPIKKKFLKVPGATDIAIRNNTLFINQATDLITLSFNENTFEVKLLNRNKDVLTKNRISPDGVWFDIKNDEVIVDWKLKN